MPEIIMGIIAAAASFLGSYAALKVHVNYMRRDIDAVTKRVGKCENDVKELYIEMLKG